MNTWFFSFGSGHTKTIGNVTVDINSLVAITAPDAGTARELMFSMFGPKWAFQRDEMPERYFFPRGVVLRIVVEEAP